MRGWKEDAALRRGSEGGGEIGGRRVRGELREKGEGGIFEKGEGSFEGAEYEGCFEREER